MTFVRDISVQRLAEYPVPNAGTWNSVAANQIPLEALYQSNNVFIREGKIRSRPGLLLVNSTTFDNPVIGGAMAVTPTQKINLAFTKTSLYSLSSTDISWQLRVSSGFAISDNFVDIAFHESSLDYFALIASHGYNIKQWSLSSGISTITSAPQAKSICVASRRVVALVDPHTIRWSAILDHQSWPALAIARLAATNDIGIAVRSLSTLSFVVYKERSIYIARAQAGSDAQGFTFSEPIIVEGPASPYAIVVFGGVHFYITRNGRIAVFDGSNYPKWIADGIWLYLQNDIDQAYAHKMFGFFDYRLHCLVFMYPRQGDNGQIKGMIVINIPLEGTGITTPAPFLGQTSKPVSMAYETRFQNTIDRSMLFTSTVSDMQSFYFDENTTTDDSTVFNCSFQLPLYPLPDMRHYHVSLEIFLERAFGNGHMDILPVYSDALENKTGTVLEAGRTVLDLSLRNAQEYLGFTTMARFFGVRCEWRSSSIVRYAGSILYGRPLTS